MKILVIYNPQAGGGRAKALLPDISAYLAEKGLDANIISTHYPAHAIEIAAQEKLDDYEAIIASGGDGTLFEVLNGYYQNPIKDKPPIGLIPNGTGNAFMKELKLLATDWKKAIDIITKNKRRTIDVGKFTTENKTYHFLNIVGMGFVTEIAEASIPLKWMGNTSYTVATLLKMIFLKSQKMTLEIDGECLERDGVFVEVANSQYTGTTFFIAPEAEIDDGKLDVIILNKISRFKLLKVFTSIFDGTHINYPEIEYIKAKTIKVIEERPGKLLPDGEILGSTPVEIECLHKDIKFLWD
jgi:YegS/Rv2252/BmrU family lipid kinase